MLDTAANIKQHAERASPATPLVRIHSCLLDRSGLIIVYSVNSWDNSSEKNLPELSRVSLSYFCRIGLESPILQKSLKGF